MASAYSEEKKKQIFDDVLKQIFEGQTLTKSLRNIGVSNQLFYEILKDSKFPERAKEYARACEARADKIFDEMLEIVDDGSNDLMTIVKGDIEYQVENKEVVNRSRLRYDARKWILGKLSGKYADSLKLQGDAENPIEQKIQVEVVSSRLLKTEESEE